jgi:tetrahedral aminopeptidase
MSPAPSSPTSLESLLPPLLAAFGPPGREAAVRSALRRLLRGAGTWEDDPTGNLHLHRSGEGRRLLLAAHMDAPGIIVTRLEGESGQARLAILGARRPAELVGASLRFEDGRSAVVSWDRKEGAEPEADQLLLETGVARKRTSGRGAARAVRDARANGRGPLDVGDVAAIDDRPGRLGDYWCAANIDDRAGCAALVHALTRARRVRYDVHAVFTAQSDLGARGATTSAFGIDPELAIVIDVAHAGEPKETSGFSVGKGPCVALKEQGFLAHPEMLEIVRKAARAARLPLQYLIREGEGSDARAVRASRSGVPTAVIAIPARRTGGVCSLVHARDLEQTAALIAAILSGAGDPAPRARARASGAGPRSKARAKARRTKRGGAR